MARTTSAAVQGILEETASLSLTTFIATASSMVTKHCAAVSDYTAAELELIERYLAAHLYHVSVPRADAERAGRVSQTLRSRVDKGLDLTHYGQQAMLLDWAGGLSALNERIKKGTTVAVGITWLGNEEDELDDDEE
jgi:hypothetical protein